MKFTGIIAMTAKGRVIGINNTLPWHIKEDLQFFKQKTSGGDVIMGRKTYEGMGVPHLRNRTLWVLTNENKYGWMQLFDPRGGQTNIVTRLEDLPDKEYWVAGGLTVYERLMPIISEFFVTYISQEYSGDTVMPQFEHVFAKSETVLATPHFEIKRYFDRIQENATTNQSTADSPVMG